MRRNDLLLHQNNKLAKRCGLRNFQSPDTQRDEDILQLIDPIILSSSLEMWSTGILFRYPTHNGHDGTVHSLI